MTTTSTSPVAQSPEKKSPGGLRVGVQKVGSFLSGMIMPIIPALIAWGIITAVIVNVDEFTEGTAATDAFGEIIGPMIHYLLPILIAVQGGKMIYDIRGAVVGATATFGVIVGSDFLIAQANAALPEGVDDINEIHMFIGAMIMGPLAAWVIKRLDALWEGKVKAGFEMLVNMFSAGITAFLMAVVGFFALAPIVNGLMDVLGGAVRFLVDNGLLPLTSIIIEPAKVFFLNNAINHGVLTPLGIAEAAAEGKSILFLLEANPGPGFGVLMAFTVFGVGAARATAPGAALIQFAGGIHEVYFPYVLMKPALLLAVIGGGATGVATNVLFDAGLRAPAAPGSIFAVLIQTASDSYLGVTLSVILSAAVSFTIAAMILLASRKRDLQGDDSFSDAVARTEAAKGKSSAALAGLAAQASSGEAAGRINSIIFACDAGMGSSAMGASVLRKKIADAGIEGVTVTNKAVASLPGDTDLVITQQQLTERARGQEPQAIHVSVDSFMDAPEYEEVVELVRRSAEGGDAQPIAVGAGPAEEVSAPASAQPEASGILSRDRVRIHAGSATRDEAMAEAAAALEAAGAVTGEYLAAMHQREETVSTFMGNELAIPHGTHEAKDAIRASALSVARYDDGVDWGGQRATFVVGIAGVGEEHLQILSRIARLFADKQAVQRLKDAATEDELLELLSVVDEG
ncbi:PTS mannitol transporter subunit IICBA [Nesterenkonia xinjiangensis]|uniref:Mannitol-specific phosphotransferase enzyme IIA component n=1 Tax=Nesterenkonia xinjiangensis TaxID=225327 RepID=A0A7Z0GJY7_9MICC|nr:PTS mannitol transporter subunit IICBA [Nesterenkonia xinjiangensis]NYJ77370.1 PTS system mannitol-specific IIC component [Nesterenkonia xinjiangensis]